jgi:hypothetical protein
MPGHDSTFATQARAADTLRWGGRTAVTWGPTSAAGGNAQANLNKAVLQANHLGVQLVNAHWRWPLTWQTTVILTPQFAPDEGGTVIVRIDWILGSGDAQQNFSTFYTMAPQPGTGLYRSVVDSTTILAGCDLQAKLGTGSIATTGGEVPGPGTTTQDTLEIGVFVAPYTESHALLHAAENSGALVDANRRDETWMPPGFLPEPLGYRR